MNKFNQRRARVHKEGFLAFPRNTISANEKGGGSNPCVKIYVVDFRGRVCGPGGLSGSCWPNKRLKNRIRPRKAELGGLH